MQDLAADPAQPGLWLALHPAVLQCRATHELKRTHDWVAAYCYDDHHKEVQCTIVTETRGPLIGRRVVRGRERECRDYYSGLEGRD